MAHLKRVSGSQSVTVELGSEYVVIGRSTGCDMQLENDGEISREHCGLRRYSDGRYTVIDFGSRNGTFVNGVRVFEETKLADGDQLRLGRRVEFTFVDPEERQRQALSAPLRAEQAPGTTNVVAAEETSARDAEISVGGDPTLSKAMTDVQHDLEKKSYQSLLKDIVRQTQKKPKKTKKPDEDDRPNVYW